jgi:hypothetical protein
MFVDDARRQGGATQGAWHVQKPWLASKLHCHVGHAPVTPAQVAAQSAFVRHASCAVWQA